MVCGLCCLQFVISPPLPTSKFNELSNQCGRYNYSTFTHTQKRESADSHNGQTACSCSQLTRHRKSKFKWLHGVATARSVTSPRQITQLSRVAWLESVGITGSLHFGEGLWTISWLWAVVSRDAVSIQSCPAVKM